MECLNSHTITRLQNLETCWMHEFKKKVGKSNLSYQIKLYVNV